MIARMDYLPLLCDTPLLKHTCTDMDVDGWKEGKEAAAMESWSACCLLDHHPAE